MSPTSRVEYESDASKHVDLTIVIFDEKSALEIAEVVLANVKLIANSDLYSCLNQLTLLRYYPPRLCYIPCNAIQCPDHNPTQKTTIHQLRRLYPSDAAFPLDYSATRYVSTAVSPHGPSTAVSSSSSFSSP